MDQVLRKLVTAGSCLLLAALVTTVFVAVASQLGRYSQIDIYLGAAWVFALSLVISSPMLIPLIRKKMASSGHAPAGRVDNVRQN